MDKNNRHGRNKTHSLLITPGHSNPHFESLTKLNTPQTNCTMNGDAADICLRCQSTSEYYYQGNGVICEECCSKKVREMERRQRALSSKRGKIERKL